MGKTDFHIHSYFSTDSVEDPEEIVKTAIKRGMEAICFTDHIDLDFPEVYREEIEKSLGDKGLMLHRFVNGLESDAKIPLFKFDMEHYITEISDLKLKYYGDIDIKIGAEFGLRPYRADLCKEYSYMKRHYKLDFVLGSLHLVDDRDPFYKESWGTCDINDFIEEYFYELHEAIEEYGDFDSLAHIDYVARYMPNLEELKHDPEQINDFADSLYEAHAGVIDDILKTIIRRGQALEINTAGLYGTYAHTHPTKQILRAYSELGGVKFSYGSDAHKADDVGRGLL
ncbi:MAG: histidinol-phosphatase HisJ family protein [Lachnospiraceae bacterium]|nr:histidinol-phosphatase HisJ family protein [Lachnospiraceae bacterium]